ncbi:uncharacterized protein KY384_008549 [Bacidia gigantensis]|uniref:uncharacterized protein n=1 Tax=Bacidia gigantensis TaxID=2732470 RepID=UPI001D04A8F3|nr:uncharacterized protein KY384_008549 [Bacidia gigantensis]KAG8527120.1 hypothetical protein KY384_008549 [Bacidia gigantensis]
MQLEYLLTNYNNFIAVDVQSAQVDPLPTIWKRFDWWTEFSEKNVTRVDELWSAILPSHGFVAMDTSWARRHNTPLYVFGDDTAGDGQYHQCRDWNALRDFATENTACYRDSVTPIILGDHFGYCDDGNDGVIDARRANVTVEEVHL